MRTPTTHYAHGKLLLTGEYFILDGALSLAVPTKYGQRFSITSTASPSRYDLVWSIFNTDAAFNERSFAFYAAEWEKDGKTGDPVKDRLLDIFRAAEMLLPGCTKRLVGKRIDCHLEFPENWGLGSSSTLIHFVANFLGVDQHKLLTATFSGSGYDLACAGAAGPLLYRRSDDLRTIVELDWSPEWLKNTYFVHLNRKQNSREGIAAYRKVEVSAKNIAAIDQITFALTESSLHLRAAAQLIEAHEELVAGVLGIERVRERFSDFPGTVKSLGAWGGDFIWVLSEEPMEKVRAYFNERGYSTFIPYHDMVL